MKRRFCSFLLLLALYLGLHNGYIALWETGQQYPTEVFPYRAALYPKIDQHALAEGIPVSDSTDLRRLLEDFLS